MSKSRNTSQKSATNKSNEGRFLHRTSPKENILDRITSKIIALIEAGEATGSIKWIGQGGMGIDSLPINMKTGNTYSGINVLLLWATANDKGYSSPYWLTYKQAQELGGQVRKNEKGTECVYWNKREIEDQDAEGETKTIAFAKPFTVFNLDQIDGIDRPEIFPAKQPWEIHQAAQMIIDATGARIEEGGTRAFYFPSRDFIQMPDKGRFASAENFYAVKLHELTHWTAHPSRCNRNLSKRFGDEAYAMEELIAELGAAFLNAEVGLSGTIEGHASYIKSWLKVLKDDNRAIITAASQASKAAEYILQFSNQEIKQAA